MSRSTIRIFLCFALSLLLLNITIVRSQQSECKVDCTATVPATGRVGAPVIFSATATGSNCGSSPAYQWDFGDGTLGSSQTPAHVYLTPGTYTWKFTTTAAAATRIVDTIAGGYGDGASAKQVSITNPVAVARDPQGKGIYLVDEPGGVSLIRFINTGSSPVTIAGLTILPGTIRLIAGGGNDGVTEDVPGLQASFQATGIVPSPTGDVLYFTDDSVGRVRLINISSNVVAVGGKTTGVGRINTFASVQGNLSGIALDPTNGSIHVSDASAGVNKVYKITQDGLTVTTIAGNGVNTSSTDPLAQIIHDATKVPLLVPRDIVFDSTGNLYITDSGHARVVKVDTLGKLTLAAQFPINPPFIPNPYPAGLAIFSGGVYVANGNTHTINRVADGNKVAGTENFICDYSASNCGDGGPASNATFYLAGTTSSPPLLGLESDANGIYILDQGTISKGRIRYLNLSAAPVTIAGVTIAPGSIDRIAGNGLQASSETVPAISSALGFPTGVAVDANGNFFVADPFDQYIRFVNRGSSPVIIFPNTPAAQTVLPGYIAGINKDIDTGNTDGVPVNFAGFDTPQGLAVTPQGLFVADSKRGTTVQGRRTGSIRFINTTNTSVTFYPGSQAPITVPPGYVATIGGGGIPVGTIGDGQFAKNAKFLAPTDIAVNPMTGDIFIADVGNRAVRKINGNTGIVSSLNLPAAQYTGLAFNSLNQLYVADYDNNNLLIETGPGSGSFRQLNTTALNKPRDVAIDSNFNAYVTNSGDQKIVRVSATGIVETMAGALQGFDGDGGPAVNARINIDPATINIGAFGQTVRVPTTVNIAIGPNDNVFFTDTNNNRVRRLSQSLVSCIKTGTITITGESPAPSLNSLSPSAAAAGGPAFTLTANGANFTASSKVRWNGQDRETVVLSSTQVTAAIPGADIASAGTAQVTVFTPTPGGGVTEVRNFTIGVGGVASVSAASFLGQTIAAESIVAAFGVGMATGTEVAQSLPLPTSLLGTTVLVNEQPASLFFVSSMQINYYVPTGTAAGLAEVKVLINGTMVALGQMQIAGVAPGMFSANRTGQGVAAAVALRVVGGVQSFEATSQYDGAVFQPLPVDLGPEGHEVYLILYGTGFRSNSGAGGVGVKVEGLDVGVLYAGAQGQFVGLDQLNVGPIPRSLIGRGVVNIALTVDGKPANVVQLTIK